MNGDFSEMLIQLHIPLQTNTFQQILASFLIIWENLRLSTSFAAPVARSQSILGIRTSHSVSSQHLKTFVLEGQGYMTTTPRSSKETGHPTSRSRAQNKGPGPRWAIWIGHKSARTAGL